MAALAPKVSSTVEPLDASYGSRAGASGPIGPRFSASIAAKMIECMAFSFDGRRNYWGVSFNSLLVNGVRYDIDGVPLSVKT